MSAGVWVVGSYDHAWQASSVHGTELEALRLVNAQGWGNAVFVPFGQEISAAVRGEPDPAAERREREAEIFDEGWSALSDEMRAQAKDPSHPITRTNPYRREETR
jgi:hypothetical protein